MFKPVEINGKWYMGRGKKYWTTPVFESKQQAKIYCVQSDAIEYDRRIDKLVSWLRDNDPNFNKSDPRGFLA